MKTALLILTIGFVGGTYFGLQIAPAFQATQQTIESINQRVENIKSIATLGGLIDAQEEK